MHPFIKRNTLLLSALAAGLTGALARLILYRVGFDEKGILSASHPLHLFCLLLMLGMAVWFGIRLWRYENPHFSRSFRSFFLPRLILGLAGCGLLALNGISLAHSPRIILSLPRLVLCYGSAFCMVFSSAALPRSRSAGIFCNCVICIYFLIDMLCRYQGWSGNPQLPDCVFHILACAFLISAAYQRMALEVGLERPRLLLYSSLMALLLCLMTVTGPERPYHYLAGACWSAANLIVPPCPAKEDPDVPA